MHIRGTFLALLTIIWGGGGTETPTTQLRNKPQRNVSRSIRARNRARIELRS